MARTHTPSYVVTRRIIVNKHEAKDLDKIMRITHRMYNAGVRFCLRQLELLKEDVWYQEALKNFFASKDEDESKMWSKEIFLCAEQYSLSERELQKYFENGKVSGYEGGIGINIVQKNATALYAAVKKALFGRKIHFRKFGQTVSFEDKKADSGIIYKRKTDTVRICGKIYSLKAVRKSDEWLQKAMESKVKYCRVVRKPFGTHYRYFLQIVMEGFPPAKHTVGAGTLAIDPGVSTMTAYNGKKLDFKELAPDIRKYQEAVRNDQKRFSRLMRINNPDCFDENGRHIKGKKVKFSKSMQKSKMRIKSAFRKQSEYVKQSNNHLANEWLEMSGSIVKIETMNYKALQKKSSKTERQEKASTVKGRDGKKKCIHKYKRRKRFGGSILKHSPAGFLETIKSKTTATHGVVIDVEAGKLKASQYDHSTGGYAKTTLDTREKTVNGHMVQRDCYSTFTIYHSKNDSTPDRDACTKDFDNFLKCQEELVERLKSSNFANPNFGTKLINESSEKDHQKQNTKECTSNKCAA